MPCIFFFGLVFWVKRTACRYPAAWSPLYVSCLFTTLEACETSSCERISSVNDVCTYTAVTELTCTTVLHSIMWPKASGECLLTILLAATSSFLQSGPQIISVHHLWSRMPNNLAFLTQTFGAHLSCCSGTVVTVVSCQKDNSVLAMTLTFRRQNAWGSCTLI